MRSSKQIKLLLPLIVVAGLFLTSCDNDNETPYASISLTADKDRIADDGQEVATFKVTADDGTDITSKARISGEGAVVTDGKFASQTAGVYKFTAEYKGVKSKDYTITVGGAGKVVLVPSKTSFLADGEDFITLRVEVDGVDMTGNSTVYNESVGEPLTALNDGSYRYDTTVPGEIAFYGQYNGMKSETVTVTAIGDQTRFYKQVALFKFTSVYCEPCVHFADTLKKVKAQYPDRLVTVNIHGNMSAQIDPFTPNDINSLLSFYENTDISFPFSVFDMRKELLIVGKGTVPRTLNYIKGTVENYPATTGFYVNSTIADNKATVTVTVKYTEERDYSLGLMLLEDGLLHSQNGYEGDYVNDHTYRQAATPYKGNDLFFEKGQNEITETFVFDLEGYAVENCNLMVYTTEVIAGGARVVNNAAYASLDGITDYRYEPESKR